MEVITAFSSSVRGRTIGSCGVRDLSGDSSTSKIFILGCRKAGAAFVARGETTVAFDMLVVVVVVVAG